MYLKALITLSLISIIHLYLIPRRKEDLLKKTALGWSLITLLTFTLLTTFHSNLYNFQNTHIFKWIPGNTNLDWGFILLAEDNISILFIGLSILLIPICILMSWSTIKFFKKEFLICLLFILILLIGVFSILDLLGFYILFEGILIPMFIIIGVWGSREEKIRAAFYFFFYTLIGSLLMLICIFKLYSLTGTTSYNNLTHINLPTNIQWWLFLGFFSSLAVKIPMIPFHIWLPQAHVEAPVAGSILLAGILLKLGGYGFIRFGFPLFPIASQYFSPSIITLSVLAITYGSFTTCRQTDIKRLVAYSSVAHMGLVTLSIFVHSFEGLIASILMMIAHGLVSSGLFMTSSIIYTRHHSRTIRYVKGLTITMPIFSIVSFTLILANIGFPLTLNFIAELFSILTAFTYSYITGILTCVGALISTVYALYYFNRVYFGNLSPHIKYSRDFLELEFQSFLPIIILTLALGIIPNNLLIFLLTNSYINISL